jgi:tetratricopeptide (TPR) repeat protein
VTPEDIADHSQALAWLDAEHRGLVVAVTLAADNGFDVHTWQLAFSLETFFYRRGHWHDWAATQQTALAAAYRLDDTYAQTVAHSGIANAQIQARHPAEAFSHLAIALRLREEARDAYGQARIHLYAGRALEYEGNYREALARSQQALRLSQTAGMSARTLEAMALNHIGWQMAQLGDYPQALRYCQQAVALDGELGDVHHEAAALDSLAYVYQHMGHHTRAADCYRRAVERFDELGDRYAKAKTLANTGDAHHADGNLAAAWQAWTQALAILDDLHHPDVDTIRAKLTPDPPQTVPSLGSCLAP